MNTETLPPLPEAQFASTFNKGRYADTCKLQGIAPYGRNEKWCAAAVIRALKGRP